MALVLAVAGRPRRATAPKGLPEAVSTESPDGTDNLA